MPEHIPTTQTLPANLHNDIYPVMPTENDQYYKGYEIEPGRLSPDISPVSDLDDQQYAYRVTIVDNKPQFTPASTLGPEDEFWLGKAGITTSKVEVERMSDSEDAGRNGKKPSRSKFSWTWQISSVILSVASLAAIIAVLVAIDQHPRLADWSVSSSSKISATLSSNISPNTLISIFAAISKAALLVAVADCIGQLKWIRFEQKSHLLKELEIYDEATRGPWGSLKLIFTTRHTALLAAFGAFIMVVSIAIDPFAQQIISHVTKTVVAQNETASFNVAHLYDTGVQTSNLAAAGMFF
jgi:hypothetical protein